MYYKSLCSSQDLKSDSLFIDSISNISSSIISWLLLGRITMIIISRLSRGKCNRTNQSRSRRNMKTRKKQSKISCNLQVSEEWVMEAVVILSRKAESPSVLHYLRVKTGLTMIDRHFIYNYKFLIYNFLLHITF